MTPLSTLPSAYFRLITASFLLLLACAIGLWDYSAQKLSSFDFSAPSSTTFDTPSDALENLEPEFTDETLDVKSGDSFSSVLNRAGLSNNQIYAIVKVLRPVFNPRDLRTDHKVFISYRTNQQDKDEKEINRLVIQLSLEKEIIVELGEDGLLKARLHAKELVHDYRHAEGKIENSLYVDAVKQGAHPKIIHDMIQAFSYDVDFQRSFHAGDSYVLLFDFHKNPDTLEEKPGEILFARLTLKGREISIYRHKSKSGGIQYYNEKGEAVKKGLLMTPVDGAKISSNFGRRKHPVLGYTKMHKGVDFAAPIGTPIMAAGAGKIMRIGPFSTFGNYIKIKHNSTYSTAYAHISRFAKGLKVGSSVRQGQIIAYVGKTGRVSGAHLHYELHKNGNQINPRSVKMMPAGKLKGKELQTFMANKVIIDERLTGLRAGKDNDKADDALESIETGERAT